MSGGRWGAIRSVVLQLTGIATTAVLARILSNEEFGVVAITVIVLTMFDLITRVGFGATIIRRENLTPVVQSTFFWASIVLGLTAGLMAALVSGPMAILAGSADAAPLVVLAAVTLPVNLAARVPSGLLSRGFGFRRLATIDIAGSVTHGVVAISLAVMGLGALAVVIGQVARSVVVLVGSFVASGFRPRFSFSRQVIAEDLSFNLAWLGGDLVAYANKNADYWFVGNRLGTGPLGIYYVAYVIPTLLRRRVTAIGHEVLYPVVARMQDDKQRIVTAYLRVARLVSFLLVPAMLGLSATADLAIGIGFGSEWLDAVDPLRIIAVGAAITSMTVVANPIFPALGRPSVLVTSGLVALLALGVGLSFSLFGGTLSLVALAVLGAAIVEAAVILNRLGVMLGLSLSRFVSAISPYLLSSLVMIAAVVSVRTWAVTDMGLITEALASLATGVSVYLLMGRLLYWSDFREQFSMVRGLLGGSPR
jgi:PST family polysaccharide transporter